MNNFLKQIIMIINITKQDIEFHKSIGTKYSLFKIAKVITQSIILVGRLRGKYGV